MPPTVVIEGTGKPTSRVLVDRIHSIICNRVEDGAEQYLVRWKTDLPTEYAPLSWQSLGELARCLEYVQDYLESRAKSISSKTNLVHLSKKRKSPDTVLEHERRPSPIARHLQSSRTPSVERLNLGDSSPKVYNGILDSENGFIVARASPSSNTVFIKTKNAPTPKMLIESHNAKTDLADAWIRTEYTRRLGKIPGKPVHLINTMDTSTPSLRFRYISECVLREGVYMADTDSQVGCRRCTPHMGRDIGCEYTKTCDCLEYAAVDESRLTAEHMKQWNAFQAGKGDTIGMPKKFPYFAKSTKVRRAGTLVPFYLNSRRPIYECNDRCRCGRFCRNKNVQFGRTVELEIFKTTDGRGWGLRCKQDLYEGQFIDTYRGEIITDAEATRREEQAASKTKASYMYSLDKFQKSEGLPDEEIYVVDGEFMGGPIKFMNHSCEPNCRQYTIHYNKHDYRVYDIALFACRDIPAGEELLFDYIDPEPDEDEDGDENETKEIVEPGEGAVPCLCGAPKCRKWLWT
ncbi:SET domain-containing protein [Polyplosphaeria fusca]|uniref:SET domain-containing protein n=1 Tax=Polyplosphaeria fusca TaxID=682080 RepID=A0A9P4RBD8_9PLEO|nr:SET domain-containing protein [Polyplosphaeria fusca]